MKRSEIVAGANKSGAKVYDNGRTITVITPTTTITYRVVGPWRAAWLAVRAWWDQTTRPAPR